MEIGQKVRFLNEVGGGTISGFQGKDIVLIEDADGFDIPMLRSQVVVIETNANNFERPNPSTAERDRQAKLQQSGPASAATPAKAGALAPKPALRIPADDEDYDPADRPLTFKAKAVERKGGELLNVCLAFIPVNARELTTTRFESYLINDSNYYLSIMLASAEGAAWHLRWQSTLEPNTKTLVETFDRSQLNDMERLAVQVTAWKQDKPFMLKPAIGVELRLDLSKFYKLHVFQPSPFFREPALLYDLIRDDRPVRKVFAEAGDLVEELDSQRQEEPMTDTTTDTPEDTAPQRTRQQEREAVKAAKRALKAAEEAARLATAAHKAAPPKDTAPSNERDPHRSKPNRDPKGDVMEVDLHISALLDNTAGLSNSVLLNTQLTEFRTIMERYKTKKGQRIVFIHGKGEGVLRDALLEELRHRYRFCTAQDASFREYGFGATMVTIH